MGFKVGEKIVYPNHGVSVVEKIGEGLRDGAGGSAELLSSPSPVQQLPGHGARRQHDLIGLRRLTQRKDITGLMKTPRRRAGSSATGDWKGRYKQNLDKMKIGRAPRASRTF